MKLLARPSLRVAVATVALAFAGLTVAVPQASAATCTKSGCNGKNPQTYGCASDAKTVSSATRYNGRPLELRYSKKCKAVWVRGESYPPGLKIQGGYIDYYGHWNTQKSYTPPSGGAWVSNENPYYAWSPMISIHAYERYRYWADGNFWEWKNSIDGCSDSVC